MGSHAKETDDLIPDRRTITHMLAYRKCLYSLAEIPYLLFPNLQLLPISLMPHAPQGFP